MSVSKVILIHGKNTDPSKKWYPWLIKSLENLGINCVAPYMPRAKDPILKEWIHAIERAKPDENSILIGHSRGGMAILRWLENSDPNIQVKKIILLATNNPEVSEKNMTIETFGFYERGPYNFEKIKQHCNNFVVMHSKDDKWVPFVSGEANARELNAKFIIFEDKGHFGSSLPKKEIPELLEEIE